MTKVKVKGLIVKNKAYVAKSNYVRISPFKLRRVANLLREKPVGQAMAVLASLPQKGAYLLKEVLQSGIANAKNNFSADVNTLVVSKLLINEGPRLKRVQPRARGRVYSIIKRSSHIHLELAEKGV